VNLKHQLDSELKLLSIPAISTHQILKIHLQICLSTRKWANQCIQAIVFGSPMDNLASIKYGIYTHTLKIILIFIRVSFEFNYSTPFQVGCTLIGYSKAAFSSYSYLFFLFSLSIDVVSLVGSSKLQHATTFEYLVFS